MIKIKFIVFCSIILIVITSCNEIVEDNTGGYSLSVNEINNYEEYKSICKNNCLYLNDSIYKLYMRDVKLLMYTLTKNTDNDDYIIIYQDDDRSFRSFRYINSYGLICNNNELDREINGIKYNHDIFAGYYYGDKFLKLNKGNKISTFVFDLSHIRTLKNCIYIYSVNIYDKSKEKIQTLFINNKTNKIYPSFESFIKENALIPKPEKEKNYENDGYHIKYLKKKFIEKNKEIIEVVKDTFIHFECIKSGNYIDGPRCNNNK